MRIIIFTFFLISLENTYCQTNNSTIKDIDGNVYHTVNIGTQIWTKENLQVIRYNDGKSISNVIGATYCWYNDSVKYKSIYGALYNWYVVNSGKLCPVGWHVPTDEDWKILEMYLGMSQTEVDKTGTRGENQGDKLKSTKGWWGNWNGTDNYGFCALPSGMHDLYGGKFYDAGYYGYWWSNTSAIDKKYAWTRFLYARNYINRDNHYKENGYSVRCLKD